MPAPIGGTTFTGSGTSSLYNYYGATTGNIAILFLLFDAPVTGLTVAGYSSYVANMPVAAGPVVGNLYCFILHYIGYNPYIMVNWTGSANMGAALEEYSNATGISPLNNATASGTSGTASASLTTDDAGGNVVVAGLGDASGNAISVTTGTQRQQNSSNACRVAVVDNSDSSPGSLTCDGTLTSSAWDAIIVELRFVLGTINFLGKPQGNPTGQGRMRGVGNAATNVELGNGASAPVFVPYGQTWPRG